MSYELEIIADDNNLTGEGPIWDPVKSTLLWVDVDNLLVYQYSALNGEKKIISRDLPVSSVALNSDEGFIFAGEEGLFLWHGKDKYMPIATEYEGELLCFNDMIAGPQGRIYAGTIYWGPDGMEKTGRLYLIDTDCSIRILDEGIELSNGLGFSPDGRILYYTDSAKRLIYAYDLDQRTSDLANKRILIEVPANEGLPDGLTVDANGDIWSAQWYGSQVVCYDANGKIKQTIAMPVQQVSSVMFGGAKLDELYITTAGESWHSNLTPSGFDSKAPMGGQLYRIQLDVQGIAEHIADLNL